MTKLDGGDRPAWAVSLHGGHSGEFCDHGKGRLSDIVDAAADFGYSVFGMTEHGPRYEEQHLYPEEVAMGWDLAKIQNDFDTYARAAQDLVSQWKHNDRGFTLLRGFEAEVVPTNRYAILMNELRERYGFDYIVGSVHWVNGMIIDYSAATFERAAASCGGLEGLALRYYEQVGEMVRALRPEVVGHLDLIRRYAPVREQVETPRVQDAARATLEIIREHGCILDINTSGLRNGLGTPYPAPWLLQMAVHDCGVPVCFGDDSHSAQDVGAGLIETRQYLLDNGVRAITYLTRDGEAIVRRHAPLE